MSLIRYYSIRTRTHTHTQRMCTYSMPSLVTDNDGEDASVGLSGCLAGGVSGTTETVLSAS